MQAALLDRLRRILADLRRPLIALSGGLDSRFLAHAAHVARPNGVTPLLVHCRGPHIPESETVSAQAFAAARDLPLTHSAASANRMEMMTSRNAGSSPPGIWV